MEYFITIPIGILCFLFYIMRYFDGKNPVVRKIKAGLVLTLFTLFIFAYIMYIIISTITGGKTVLLFNVGLILFFLLLVFLFCYKRFHIKNKEYLREIPNDVSIPMATYLIKKKIHPKRTLLATTLYLYAKESIDIDFQGETWKYQQKKEITLREDEQYIYDFLLGKEDKKNFSNTILTNMVIQNLIKQNLIKKTKKNSFLFPVFIAFILLIGYALVYIFQPFGINITDDFLEKTYYVVIGILAFLIFITIKQKEKECYVPTKEGKNIIRKIKSFENYMKDFSRLKDRKLEEVVLWKEYIAYAIALGINLNYDIFKEELPLLNTIELNHYIESKIDHLANIYDEMVKESYDSY